MALPESGALSMADIAGEFVDAAPHSLSEFYGAATGVPTLGTISIGDFYGTFAVATVNTTIVASKFENFNSASYPTPGDAGDNNTATGLEYFTGIYPNNETWLNFYCDSGVAGGNWSGAAPAAAFRDKTILAVRSLSLTVTTLGSFTANIFGNSDIPRHNFYLVGRTGSTLTEHTNTEIILNGGFGYSSPRMQTNTYDFYPTKSANVLGQITLTQAKEVISGGLITRFNGLNDGALTAPSIREYRWSVDFDYVP